MSAGVGYLRDVRSWNRFGFGSRGNVIIYDDCLVFAAVRRPLLNSLLNVRELITESRRNARFESVAREQAELAPDEVAAQDRHNWMIRREDVARAVLMTSRDSAVPAGDDIVSLVLGAASVVSAPIEHTLMIHLTSRKSRMYPSVKGVWGDAENELLRAALGDRLE